MFLFLKLAAAALVSMLVIDSVWLRTMYEPLYKKNIGHLLGESVQYAPAVFFYLLYIGGLTFLVLYPGVTSGASLGTIALRGAVFGMAAYATYDLTSQAVLRDWPTSVTIIDIIWGTLLTGAISGISVYLIRLVA